MLLRSGSTAWSLRLGVLRSLISPTAFLDAEPDLLPPEVRTAVLERLAERQRPIEEIDPRRHPPRRVLMASGIRIEGLASPMSSSASGSSVRAMRG